MKPVPGAKKVGDPWFSRSAAPASLLPGTFLVSSLYILTWELLVAFIFILNIYLWLRWVVVVSHRLLSSCSTCVSECVGSVFVIHRFSCPTSCGILVFRPGIEPVSPALQSGFLTTDWTTWEVFLFLPLCVSKNLVLKPTSYYSWSVTGLLRSAIHFGIHWTSFHDAHSFP